MQVLNENFKISIPNLNPLSREYKIWWTNEKRKCIEGYWSNGKWMPGLIYFYVNFWVIQLNKTKFSKQKVIGSPLLRDLEWEKGYVFTEARGFSGFKDDTEFTCNRVLKDNTDTEEVIKVLYPESEYPNIYHEGKLKKYIDARVYLRLNHGSSKGKPIYENNAKNIVDVESRGCLLEGSEVLLFNGLTKKVEDIIVGDQLMGKDGTARNVQWLHSGESEMYKVKSTKFKDIIVNENHSLSVKYIQFNRKGNKTIQTDFQIKDLLDKQETTKSFTNRFYRYIPNSPINFELNTEKLDIDPYYFGLWLSDGRQNCTSIKLTDNVIWEYLENFAKENNIDYKISITESQEKRKEAREFYFKDSIFRESFKKYNLLNNKHIPHIFKTSSIENRIKILEGLIDGDGCYDKKHNSYDIYCGINESIANDVMFIARSLGLYANVTKRAREDYQNTYEVIISGNLSILNPKIERKKVNLKRKRRIDTTRSSFKISPYGKGKFYGFHVDKDNEYLLSDFTVDHNTGKSFLASCAIAWNFLFDGALDYDEFLENQKNDTPFSSETMIGAIDSKYSNDLISKFKIGLENMKGGTDFRGKYYPSPFSKKFTGSLMAGKFITAKYKVKQANTWVDKGTSSKIYHRSFSDNPEAGNGTRSNVIFIEEAGFMGNLEEAIASLKDTTYNGMNKTGTIWIFGTGGQMEAGHTEALKRIFFDPEGYDCLAFDDIWENSGKIGFFVPYIYGLNDYKDSEGNTDVERALSEIEAKREKLKKAKSKEPYKKEQQNNPLKPSEAFLITEGNIFPTVELKEQLAFLESTADKSVEGQNGELIIGANGEIKWLPDLSNKLRPSDYPVKKGEATAGCIVIWEQPQYINGTIPHGLYIAGTDPYDQDNAKNSESLGSTFIYKTFTTEEGIYEWPVAEYTGRPSTASEHHENVRRLLLYYNARDLYENEKNTIKMHFEQKNSLYLLANTPTILKATANSSVNRTYGTHMTETIKDELEIYTRDWLTTEVGEGKLNLHKIYSKPLLKELISYSRNKDLNYDRVIAFMLCILLRLQNHRMKVESLKEGPKIDPFFENLYKQQERFRRNNLNN